jgi:hypothetical protein
VLEGHPEMEGLEGLVQLTIEDPDYVVKSETPAKHPSGERWVCCRYEPKIRKSRPYLRVVIEYSPTGNWVPTAYLDALPPKGEVVKFVRLVARR